jgi:HPr kinase/phosphorylase
MAEDTKVIPEFVTVLEFSAARSMGLDLQILEGSEGIGNRIRSLRIQKLGLALAGLAGYIRPEEVQVFGGSEMNYLGILSAEKKRSAISRLKNQSICCVIITRGLEPPAELLDLARSEKIPILRTSQLSSITITKINRYLEERLAPHLTVHGVLLEIFGLGVLLLGKSGIGKSECALELVMKGHRLIADDSVILTKRGPDRLTGAGGQVLKHHMELRGLGIINIRELFGISATGTSQNLDFVVRMERWNHDVEYDRLGLDRAVIEFMGVKVPLIEMPVAPGRNASTFVEVAARLQMLRLRGYKPAGELTEPMQADANRDQP